MEDSVDPISHDGLLSVGDLVRMFEESEDASYSARQLAERDRDYVDNKQLTAEELSTLRKRGQPPSIDNRIKTKIDYLVGVEKNMRVDPKALPRTPKHESDADGATQALRYVADSEDYDAKRSAIWRNLLIEGAGGVGVSVEPYGEKGEIKVRIRRIPWDRLFFDPHSSEADFEDAGYKGVVLWMDYDDALAKWPDAADILDTTLNEAPSQTYDDKPKVRLWADKARRRVRICQIWIKRDNDWYFAEYTKGGILKAGPSPYVTDTGESDCELIFQSAYVDRDNDRYGLVREMIPIQDEINKRRSKSLHLLNTAQIVMEDGAVQDVEKTRREAARPDGVIVVNPGGNGLTERFQFNTRTDLAEGHFKLLQEAKNSIDLKGPNATEMGDKTGGSNAASGKAIIASQQGGMTQIGDLMDSLRHLDKRVYRAVWARIRQFWTAETWVRVTDDEENIKWLGLNVDPMQVQMLAQQNPEAAQRIAGAVGNVAELDCDIIIDVAPDGLTPQLEQFQTLAELKKFDTNNEIPFRAIVQAAPNLKDKAKILAAMDKAQQPNPMREQAQQVEMAGAVAKVKETESKAVLNMANARAAGMPDQAAQPAPQQIEYQLPPQLQEMQAMAEIQETNASRDLKLAQAQKTQTDSALAPQQANHQAMLDQANFKQGIRDRQEDRKLAARKTVAA